MRHRLGASRARETPLNQANVRKRTGNGDQSEAEVCQKHKFFKVVRAEVIDRSPARDFVRLKICLNSNRAHSLVNRRCPGMLAGAMREHQPFGSSRGTPARSQTDQCKRSE